MFDEKLKSFLGLTFAFEARRYASSLVKKANKGMADTLAELNFEYDEKQEEMESSFDVNNQERIVINIDDDFSDEDNNPKSTTMIVDSREIPNAQCFEILQKLMEHIKENRLVPSSVSMKMDLYNLANIYPYLVVKEPAHFVKQWEIKLGNMTHGVLYDLVESMKGAMSYKGVPVVVISES